MSGGRSETVAKDIQAVAGTGRGGCGRDVDGGSGGGTEGGGGGYGRDRDRYRLNRWENNIANITLRAEPNDPLAYAPRLEYHHPIMSRLGETGGRLEREIERGLCAEKAQTRTYQQLIFSIKAYF